MSSGSPQPGFTGIGYDPKQLKDHGQSRRAAESRADSRMKGQARVLVLTSHGRSPCLDVQGGGISPCRPRRGDGITGLTPKTGRKGPPRGASPGFHALREEASTNRHCQGGQEEDETAHEGHERERHIAIVFEGWRARARSLQRACELGVGLMCG